MYEFAYFSVELDVSLPKDTCFVFIQYLHDRMPKKKASDVTCKIAVLKWEFYLFYICSTSLYGVDLCC